ncbi:MAG: XRE family transcriptional regulator [Sphingobium sp.]|nr:XRE family transcriptional regulator [Sphingobium sp.]
MESFESKLIKAVSAKRERLGLSIRALATQIGMSFSTLARIERGEGSPDNNSKVRLIEWLGPDADEAGLTFESVALVHFRAMKNIQSGTVQSLLHAAACLKDHHAEEDGYPSDDLASPNAEEPYPELSKDQLESIVAKFRSDLDLSDRDPLDSLQIDVEGVRVVKLTSSECLDVRTMRRLRDEACGEWSAMSVPLDASHEKWVVLLNDCHTMERQRVTLLEEYWHILMGHKLTKVARIAQAYGRTYDKAEEHDAYYLASATLLPKSAVQAAVAEGKSSAVIAKHFGTSPELVEYRIKRLGLWREHVGKKVALKD